MIKALVLKWMGPALVLGSVAALSAPIFLAGPLPPAHPKPKGPGSPPLPPPTAPEIDPTAAGSIATLLVGGVLLLQARGARKRTASR